MFPNAAAKHINANHLTNFNALECSPENSASLIQAAIEILEVNVRHLNCDDKHKNLFAKNSWYKMIKTILR